MRKFKILLDGSGTASAISVIKGLLKQSEYEIYLVSIDRDPFNAGRYLSNKFYTVPTDPEPRTEAILEICYKEKIDLFIPIIDETLLELARRRKDFEKIGTFLLLAPLESLEIANNKMKTFQFFIENNIPTPKVYTSFDHIKYPAFIKPCTGGRASINAFKINDKEELKFYTSKISEYIIQEYIEGEEFTADCLASLDGNFLIECVVRRRLETKGGLAIKCSLVSPNMSELIKNYVEKINEKLRIPGAFNIQGFIIDKKNLVFIEINPRFAGTHAFTIEAGLNSIKFILDMLNGESPQNIKNKISINYDLKMIRYWDEIFIDESGRAYNPWKLWTKKNN